MDGLRDPDMLEKLLLAPFLIFLIIDMINRKFSVMTLFEEHPGEMSMMRFLSFLCFFDLSWYLLNNPAPDSEVVAVLGILSFFPKLLQKWIEKKYSSNNQFWNYRHKGDQPRSEEKDL